MERLLGELARLRSQEHGSAMKNLVLFGAVLLMFGSVAGSWAVTLMEMLDHVAQRLPQ